MTEFDFGTIFMGQKRIIPVQMINQGMYKSSYVVMAHKIHEKGPREYLQRFNQVITILFHILRQFQLRVD
jgi:hypothetical protein